VIPGSIKREHVLRAIDEIKRSGVPEGRGWRKFYLEYEGKRFPQKYIISLANKYANGLELDSSEFSGGNESNSFLRNLGFNVVLEPHSKSAIAISPQTVRRNRPKARHSERCQKCKDTVGAMLEKIYGRVERNFKFEVGSLPKDFWGISDYASLEKIFRTLQEHRGFRDFVKAKTLPNCDYFMPDSRFILEYDESQHFTLPRKIALENYPRELKQGFDRKRWIEMCLRIRSTDNNPPYRGEQRAWYDTLRDFLPELKGLNPTVRIFARDSAWCRLDPNNLSDVVHFKSFLNRTFQTSKIELREDPDPFLARIIITRDWKGDPEESASLLSNVYEKWPKNTRVKLIVTPGGFLQFDWPASVSAENIGDSKYPENRAVNFLVEEARNCLEQVMNHNLRAKLGELADYITLGIDSHKEKVSTTHNYISQPHIELVFLIDLKRHKFYWTGKSYPTSSQQKGLARITDLATHFLDLEEVGRIMVLGCHDLTVFNPRSNNAGGWRMKVNEQFKELSKKQQPVCVLHHPHTTVKRRTWLNAWSCLEKTLPSVKYYAGAGRYFETDRERSEWDALNEVLESTKKGSTLDFIV
jgi:hypothetical protein